MLNKIIQDQLIPYPEGYQFYVTDTVRGYCRYSTKSITVPKWAFGKGWDYLIYYICHEIAHAMTPRVKGDQHGPQFMESFKTVCPVEYQHYELGYKPRLARAAGIKEKK
jgi:predicted metal-dependent hydrolase